MEAGPSNERRRRIGAQGAPGHTRSGDGSSGGKGWPQEGGLGSETGNCGAENKELRGWLALRK